MLRELLVGDRRTSGYTLGYWPCYFLLLFTWGKSLLQVFKNGAVMRLSLPSLAPGSLPGQLPEHPEAVAKSLGKTYKPHL